jgi:hypothetical protein
MLFEPTSIKNNKKVAAMIAGDRNDRRVNLKLKKSDSIDTTEDAYQTSFAWSVVVC